MKALSASTTLLDPYRAGLALGESLAGVAPEVVFLFSSVGYGDGAELLEGLHDALERDDLIVVGNIGDGVYEDRKAADMGAAALALNSEGRVRWVLSAAEGIGEDPENTARTALDALDAQLGGDRPAFIYLAADFRTDASRLERVLATVDVPIVGGMAGDGYAMTTSRLYANRRALQDGVVMLAAVGPVAFEILLGQSLVPVGAPGRIDAAAGTVIRGIDGMSAMSFVEKATGRPALNADRGALSLAIFEPEHPQRKRLRSIKDSLAGEGALGLFGGVEPGKMVQVCAAGRDHLSQEIVQLAEQSRQVPFEPVAALVVSCAWRKNVLGEHTSQEVEAIADAHPRLAIVGWPSLGEIAPLQEERAFTTNMFHNSTCVLLMIGQGPCP
jgi:hypothetical protein